MAAGLGFIEFTTGDVLTAAAANGYLASQVVMVFADSAARTTAITSPQEGMISFLKDTNAVEAYDGAAWVAIGGSSPLTTKGDLYTFDTADARLGVGANGTVLTADSAETTGLKWATPAGGGGKVLQVVQATTTTEVSLTSANWTDSNLSASITPSAATSKILVLTTQVINLNQSDDTGIMAGGTRLLRGATTIFTPYEGAGISFYESDFYRGITSMHYLDSPSTTSATTYKTQIYLSITTNAAIAAQPGSAQSSIILLEIGA